MLSSMLHRLKVPVVGCVLVTGYFWTGTAAKLWIAERTPGQPVFGDGSLRGRPMRGYARAGANMPFTRAFGFNGPLSGGPLMGSATGDFLVGLGIGIDAESPDYDARCQTALERVVTKGGFNPWRNHARLELAHLLVRPSSVSPRTFSWGDEDVEGPAWITLGMVDTDRWWIVHEPSGTDPTRAGELCTAILHGSAGELALAEALRLKADLAAESWDFGSQDSLLRDLVESCPSSPFAQPALNELGDRLARQGRLADAAGLARRLLPRLSATDRVRLAPTVADLQAAAESIPAARATLESALQEAELLARDLGGRKLANADPRTPLREALKRLPAAPTAAPPSPAPPGPAFPVRSRLLAAGKALGGISVGLVPLPLLAQPLPPPLASGLTTARTAGTFTEPEKHGPGKRRRQRQNQNQAWQLGGITGTLRQNPALVARSDADGNLTWPAVPAGVYGVVLRAGTWQLPNAGRDLAVTPLAAPVSVSGPGTVVPDLRLNASVRLTPIAADARPPGLRWEAVPRAASYRVSLATTQTQWGSSAIQVRCVAAPALDPDVVWWREGVKGTSLRLTPEHFAGPAGEALRGGIHAGVGYRWSVEARDASGRIIATGETLAPGPRVKLPSWTALRPATGDATARPAAASGRSLPVIIPAFMRNDQSQFSSPFLDSLLQEDEEAAPAAAAAKRAVYPTLVARGQGLPPRAALAMPSAAPPAAGRAGLPVMAGGPGPGGIPGQLPPGARPHVPGSMPPGFAGTPSMLPSLPPGTVLRPGTPPSGIAGVALRPGPAAAATTVSVTLEAFGTGSPHRWTADKELPAIASNGLPLAGPLVLTPRDSPLTLPPGPGRLFVRLSSLQAEATVVLLDTHGKPTRVKLRPDPATRTFHTLLAPGEWKLQSLDLRPSTSDVRLESLTMEVPPTTGLYARAWREGEGASIEITNLAPSPQTVTLGEAGTTSTLDLAPRGKARFPITVGENASPVILQFAGKNLEVPVRGIPMVQP